MIKATMKIWHKESGMSVLATVLMLATVGVLILSAILGLMYTASRAGQMEERTTREFYSADAGITAALWRIKTNYELDWLDSENGLWQEDIYSHSPAYESYTLPLAPNGNSVAYTIAPKWVLEGLETPNGTQQRNTAPNVKVSLSYQGTGSVSGQGKYQLLLYYDGNEGGLGISRIGCWLPAGLGYVTGSSSCENTTSSIYPYLVKPVQVADYRGGKTVIWNFSQPVGYNLFPSSGSMKAITFEFTPNESLDGGFSWLSDNMTSNYLAWSALNVFEINSTATSPSGETTRATSYTVRDVGDGFGSAVEGDYEAFGNTLMRDDTNQDQSTRDRLYRATSSTVTAIPSNAQVEHIFLYWSGWKCKPWNGLTAAQLTAPSTLPVTYNVNQITVTCNTTVGGPTFCENITATNTQAQINYISNTPNGWSYSCFADITDRVKSFFKSNNVSYVGNATYNVGHYDFYLGATAPSTGDHWYRLYNFNYTAAWPYTAEKTPVYGWTRYPLGSPMDGNQQNYEGPATSKPKRSASYEDSGNIFYLNYVAWSIIVVYTSPSTLGRQLYLYDTLQYGKQSNTLVMNPAGFVVPDLTDETDAAKLTCFVGEGDESLAGDSVVVNSTTLPALNGDTVNFPSNNVWNSKSLVEGNIITGIDIDTWPIDKTIIKPGDTTANVQLPTDQDQWSLIYMILAFRSKISGGGNFIYDLP
ncbi:MAG: hypothetical protein ABSA18_09020 [Dehalococcoidia bacterium]|jgi:hypothetical protein